MKLSSKNMIRRAGFGILEMTVVLAVIAVIAVSMAMAMPRMTQAAKVAEARQEMHAYLRAVIGDPDNGYYGFIGDVGRLPRNVSELLERGDLPAFEAKDKTYRVGMGWNGPYLASESLGANAAKDPWGVEYQIAKDGRIVSAGPDSKFQTPDDLYFPDTPVSAGGTLRIELSQQGEYVVRLFGAKDGKEQFRQVEAAPFIFENVHRGPHAVEVWKVNGSDKKVDLVRRTIVISGPFGGIFRVEL